ncbi:MAG: dihydrofolate reductase family protein [Bacteroidota bacterium]
MRKIILTVATTLDGFIEGPHGELDWLMKDPSVDFADILNEILLDVDAIFYGRVSYELWGNYRPGPEASDRLKAAYELQHSKQKYVFSRTIGNDDTQAIFLNGDLEKNVRQILKQRGKNIWLYGGANLLTQFINLGLVDIYRMAVHPVLIGAGKPLFQNVQQQVNLRLEKATTSATGVVVMSYNFIKTNP